MYRRTLTGLKFGRLFAYRRQIRKNGLVFYRCLCDCGTRVWVVYTNLGRGTNSCGCLKREILHRRKQPDDVIRLNKMWRYYRRNAKLRAVAWRLSKQEFQALVNQPCHYCGYHDDWCGIDRVDNNEGYVIENSVPCCRWCNWGKNERTLEEFNDWVRRLYERTLVHVR